MVMMPRRTSSRAGLDDDELAYASQKSRKGSLVSRRRMSSGRMSVKGARLGVKFDESHGEDVWMSQSAKHMVGDVDVDLLEEYMARRRTANLAYTPEEVPVRFSFFNSKRDQTVHSTDLSGLVKNNESLASLFEPPDSVWWLDCICPTDEEIKVLARAFGLHPLTTEDICTQEPREKVELFKSYYFVSFHTFEGDCENEEFLDRINVYIVVFRQGILTFHFSPVRNPANVRRRVRQLQDYTLISSDWLCYALIDDITDGFGPIISAIEYESDAIEDSVVAVGEGDFRAMLFRIGESRRKVMTLMRLLQGKADVIKMLAKRCASDRMLRTVTPGADIALYLGDIQDHLVTMFQSLLAFEKILSRAHLNYLSQIQVESFCSNNEMMAMMSRVTVLGTILVPMNVVTGLFGMNVRVPGKHGDTFGWFGGILGFLVFVCVVCAVGTHLYIRHITQPERPSTESIREFRIGRHGRNEVPERHTVTSKYTRITRYDD